MRSTAARPTGAPARGRAPARRVATAAAAPGGGGDRRAPSPTRPQQGPPKTVGGTPGPRMASDAVASVASARARAKASPSSVDPSLSDTIAVILAGGGHNNPLAAFRAMPAVEIANLALIDLPIANLIKCGITKMFVLTQFNSHALNAHLTRTYPPALFGGPPGTQGFVDVLACHQTADDASWYAGSADAVRRNLDALLEPVNGGRPPREVVVLSGHALADVDFAGLVRAHRAAGSAVTLATRSVPADRASRLGLVRVDPGTGAVTDFAEKPTGAAMERLAHASAHATPDAPYEASTGVYVFDATALKSLLATPAAAASVDGEFVAPRSGFDMHFGADVIPHALVAGLPVSAVHGSGPWRDVSSLPDFYDAVTSLARPGSGGVASLTAAAAVLGARTGRVLPPCRAVGPSTIARSLISEGCTLDGATVVDSVVGNNVSFGPGSRLEASILLGNDLFGGRDDAPTVGAGSVLSRVIVDRNAVIGPDCTLTNAARVVESDRSGEGFVIQDGLIVVLRGAALPAGLVV